MSSLLKQSYWQPGLCPRIYYAVNRHGVSSSRIHVLAQPWTAMLLSWNRGDVTIVAIDSEWKTITQTKQRRDMRLTSWLRSRLNPSLDDFPWWIQLDLDPGGVSSETRSGSKPRLKWIIKSRLTVNMAPGMILLIFRQQIPHWSKGKIYWAYRWKSWRRGSQDCNMDK